MNIQAKPPEVGEALASPAGERAPLPLARLNMRHVVVDGAAAASRMSSRQMRRIALAMRAVWNNTPRWVTSLENARTAVINVVLLVATLLAVPIIYNLISRDAITIQDISVPETLSDRGFTGSVMAQRIYDEMVAFGQHVRGSIPRSDVAPAALDANLKDIDVMWTGINAAFILSSVRSFFGIKDRRIIGEITVEEEADEEESKPAKYGLTLRQPGVGTIYRSAKPAERLDPLLREAALEITRRHEPLVAAYYYFYQLNMDEAQRMTEVAIAKKDPGTTAAAINIRGLMAVRMNKWSEAAKHFDEVIKLKPDFVPAYNSLSVVYRRLNDGKGKLRLDEAEALAHKSLKIDPTNAAAYLGLAHVARLRGEDEKAPALINRSLELEPTNVVLLLEAGKYYAYVRKFEEARKYYVRALDLAPTRIETFTLLASLYRNHNKIDEAFAYIQKGLAIEPTSFELNYFLARLYNLKKEYARAEAPARLAIKMFGTGAGGYTMLGESLLGQGKLAEAQKVSAKATEVFALFSETLMLQGKILEKQGKRAEAIAKYRHAVARGEDERVRLYYRWQSFSENYIVLARALEANKDPAGAIDAYRRAMLLDPDRYKAQEADIARLSKLAAARAPAPATKAAATPPRSPP